MKNLLFFDNCVEKIKKALRKYDFLLLVVFSEIEKKLPQVLARQILLVCYFPTRK